MLLATPMGKFLEKRILVLAVPTLCLNKPQKQSRKNFITSIFYIVALEKSNMSSVNKKCEIERPFQSMFNGLHCLSLTTMLTIYEKFSKQRTKIKGDKRSAWQISQLREKDSEGLHSKLLAKMWK